ncbi:MAG: pantoate--beta-alanine ligase [Dehalococcoidales bacterium]|nr:pantoate--beta-alanine ligase [Dehalococcoidales bacterium]
MRVIKTVADFREARRQVAGSLGFVPTMGYLHDGHLSLVRAARAGNDCVSASIFVNPTQFGPNEDLSRYPRDLERDLAMLRAEGTDLVFAPGVEDMYPQGFATHVDVTGPLTARLEGAARPGHFKGVATVVTKLFNIVQPTRAYFGQKDAQQALVIKKIVADLDMNLEVIVMPTEREEDGLAMSSRNVYLKAKEREAALVLSRSLAIARDKWSRGEKDAERIREDMRKLIESEPLAKIDYVSIADASTLEELETLDKLALISLAVRIGNTRLIDNILL